VTARSPRAAGRAANPVPWSWEDYIDELAAQGNARVPSSWVGPFAATDIPAPELFTLASDVVWTGTAISFNNNYSVMRVGRPQFYLPFGTQSWELASTTAVNIPTAEYYGHNYWTYPISAGNPIHATEGNDAEEAQHIPDPTPVAVEEPWFVALERYVASSETGEFASWYGEDE
jgi:hypothetical protein